MHPHNDGIVTSVIVANQSVKKVLVDNGTSADILFKRTCDMISLEGIRMEFACIILYGFSGEEVS